MSDSDADEYVYLGTPLQGSDQVALPVHQQTVRDAAGRQRLHGAFTGGFSAGFYNTVGSMVCLPLQICAAGYQHMSSLVFDTMHPSVELRRGITAL